MNSLPSSMIKLLKPNMTQFRWLASKSDLPLTRISPMYVTATHRRTSSISDSLALKTVKVMRWSFDTLSGYKIGPLSCKKVINRAIFLETVAGVPGFVAGLLRHFRSLRRMKDDEGWIETLIGEAENERFHLLTFVEVRQPGILFRAAVLAAQVLFSSSFFIAYLLNPRFCHRFVGYLEEEAVKTYTDVIEAIDDGRLGEWNVTPSPRSAILYWGMRENATMRDLILAGILRFKTVCADESNHRDVNHTLADLEEGESNPYGKSKLEFLESAYISGK